MDQHIYTWHIVKQWAEGIAHTRLSQALQEATWTVPISQSIHIAAICVLFSSAVMIGLRLLGLGSRGRPISEMVSTLIRWQYGALVVLALTGCFQTFIEPERQFVAPAFWYKMTLILVGLVLTVRFGAVARTTAQHWDSAQRTPLSAKAFAIASIMLWGAVIACGRLIGYTYIYHE